MIHALIMGCSLERIGTYIDIGISEPERTISTGLAGLLCDYRTVSHTISGVSELAPTHE